MVLFSKSVLALYTLIFMLNEIVGEKRFDPNWESLDNRTLPVWFEEAKFGIFLHWGVYSVPSFGTEWFWSNWAGQNDKYVEFMEKNYPPGFTYQDFGPQFTAEFFNAKDWVNLFQKSGAKYVVLTSKHHEGYALWPSKYSYSWNSVDVGPHRDLVGELAEAVRNYTNMKFGLYHSLYEWFHPIYVHDRENAFLSQEFVDNKIIPEMKELVENYKPEVLWSDGDWETSPEYWRSKEFLAWLYNDSPVKDTIVVNDRWGVGCYCTHGDFYSCADRYNPGVLQTHKWENAMTIDRYSWGYRRNAKIEDYMTTHELLTTMVETISCGGNILMNVGPTKDGLIAPIFQERLLDIGEWLSINGEAIYSSKPWIHQNDTNGYTWYTAKENTVYAINLHWPENNLLKLDLASDLFIGGTIATLLGDSRPLNWIIDGNWVNVTFPDKATVAGDWVWVLKISVPIK